MSPMKKLIILSFFITFTIILYSCEKKRPELTGVEGILLDSTENIVKGAKMFAYVEKSDFLSNTFVTTDTFFTDRMGKFKYSRRSSNENIFISPITSTGYYFQYRHKVGDEPYSE